MSDGPISDDHYVPAFPTMVFVEPQITHGFNQNYSSSLWYIHCPIPASRG
jgi:hypothetical protein